jgi:cation diffusion facilitator family transporter
VRYPSGAELPPEQQKAMRKALRLEWISVAYWISAVILLYFTLGQSQAMKAAWVEDILSLFPPVAFLIASRFRTRPPNARFPWGYHRAITIAYLVATVALFALGLFILVDSIDKLIKGDHPPIGLVEVFDTQIWLGWLMLGALAYGVVPSLILGRMKLPLAEALHDKVLFADSRMNQADWLTALAAMFGVVGIGFGLWFADAVAAIIIGLDIVWDGQRYLREAVADLMDERPKTYDEEKPHPLIDRIKDELRATTWVRDAVVRAREEGHVISAEIWVIPEASEGLELRVEELGDRLRGLDWRIKDVIVSPVAEIVNAPKELRLKPEAPTEQHVHRSAIGRPSDAG